MLPRTHKELIRLMLRSLLIDICVNYFFNCAEQTVSPIWLAELCTIMRVPEHFIVGRDRLIELANRSPEHVGRAFKKYLGVTPSQYVNTLRLFKTYFQTTPRHFRSIHSRRIVP